MPAVGAVQAGIPLTSATTGSVVNICPRDCTLLGFYANASTTLVIYDDAGTSTAGGVKVNISACAVGWNPLPLAFAKGLAVNQGAQVYFSVL